MAILKVLIILLVLLIVPPIAGAQSRPMDEYRVKAAFLYNFARFIEWPPEVFPDPTVSFTICVLGRDPFGRVLDNEIAGRKIDGRSVAVRRITDARRAAGCAILFVSSSERKRALAAIALCQPGILTVGEVDNETSDGMVVNFTLEGSNIRFEINPEAAEQERLRISSRLLSLATIVGGGHAKK
jgi:hypothetical protein